MAASPLRRCLTEAWYIREIKQPTGFVLDETVYDVNISENEQVVEIEIVNKLVRGNIALTRWTLNIPIRS